jgi:hypothetical protein
MKQRHRVKRLGLAVAAVAALALAFALAFWPIGAARLADPARPASGGGCVGGTPTPTWEPGGWFKAAS